MPLPSELQRAEVLSECLHSAVSRAKRMRQPKITLEVEYAEELLQLLADSLRTARQFDLVEFDGKIKPIKNQVKRIGSNQCTK
jgi:hypothetical protein